MADAPAAGGRNFDTTTVPTLASERKSAKERDFGVARRLHPLDASRWRLDPRGAWAKSGAGRPSRSLMGQPDDRLLLDDWLARSRAVALPDWKLYSGLGLTGEARVARLVRLVERARAAEVSGQPRRADFFWREAHRSLHAARASTPDWIAIARDVFWATHWALLRGRLRRMPAGTVSAEDRAFEHLAWIETLAESLPDEAATARESREAGLIAKADALQRAGRRPEALRAAEALRRLAPEIGDYLGRLASARLAVTAHELERAGDNQGRQQDALRTGIHE